MPYSPEITKKAEEYGFKAANLVFLKEQFTEGFSDPSAPGITVKIPDFHPLSHQTILEHLTNYAPEWKKCWGEFVTAYQQQKDLETLGPEAKNALLDLQGCIRSCFKEHPLDEAFIKDISKAIGKDAAEALFMVRSTGREDSVELANPGGNESKACVPLTAPDISTAIGEVLCSYVAEKSLSQRLKSKDDITKLPFFPILIQKMIGDELYHPVKESPEQETKTVYSGVIYSGQGCTRLQVAPGHGELVVNSKGNVDNYYITSEHMVYADIWAKHFRLVPTRNKTTKKVELSAQENEPHLKYNPSLDEEVVLYLHHLSQKIEEAYGMRMDIEFIYDPDKHEVSLVQARPIPLGDRRRMEPSSLSPESAAKLSQVKEQVLNGQTITPEVNRVAVITDPNEILICDTIGEALDIYLSSSSAQGQRRAIKAVVIKKPAPDTSHEAGEFSAKAIPVIQLDSLQQVRTMADQTLDGKPLILDPQRKKIVQISADMVLNVPPTEWEATLYEREILQEGVFRSTLTAQVTPYQHQFVDGKYEFRQILNSGIPSEALGLLLKKAMAGNNKEATELFSFLYQIVDQAKNLPAVKSISELTDLLESISQPVLGKSTVSQKEALSRLFCLLTTLRKQERISTAVYNQTLLTGGELFIMLAQLENGQMDLDKSMQQRLLMNYLNVFEKFVGILKFSNKKDVLAESVIGSLAEIKHQNAMMALVPDGWTKKQKNYFIQTTRLTHYLIDDADKKRWQQFCLENCATSYGAKMLGTLVGQVAKQEIHENWLNFEFTKALNEHNGDNKATFKALFHQQKDAEPALKQLATAEQQIHVLELQVPLWAEPKNFEKQYDSFKKELASINTALHFDSNAPDIVKMVALKSLNHLVDVLDRTLKSLEKSNLYEPADKALQAERFKIMLDELYALMKMWVIAADFKDAKNYLNRIEALYAKKVPPFTQSELSPSGRFSVNTGTVDTDFGNVGFERNVEARCSTLEDWFTLMHQNMLVSIKELQNSFTKKQKQEYPLSLAQMDQKIRGINLGDTHIYVLSTDLNYPNITIHYNIPLANHSAKAVVQYDQITEKTSISFEIFGNNDIFNGYRWDRLELYSQLWFLPEFTGNVISGCKHDVRKSLFHFEVEVDNENSAEQAIDWMNKTLSATLGIYNFEKDLDALFKTCIQGKLSKEKIDHVAETFGEWLVKVDSRIGYSVDKEKATFLLASFIICRRKGFPLSEFILDHPDVFSIGHRVDNFFRVAKAIEGEIQKGNVDLNLRKEKDGYSVFEVLLENRKAHLTASNENTDMSTSYELIKALVQEGKLKIQPPNYIINALLKSDLDGWNYKSEFESAYKLCEDFGLRLRFLHLRDWTAIKYLVLDEDLQGPLLDFISEKTCDLSTLYEILYMQIYKSGQFFPSERKKELLNQAFTEQLAKKFQIDIHSPKFLLEMLKIAKTRDPEGDRVMETLSQSLSKTPNAIEYGVALQFSKKLEQEEIDHQPSTDLKLGVDSKIK